MLILIMGILAVLIGVALKPFEIRHMKILYILLFIQIGYRFIECITQKHFILVGIQVILLALVVIFLIYNRQQTSILITGLGFILNLIVMIFNSGKMPVRFDYGVTDVRHIMIDNSTRLHTLSDILSLPYPLNYGMLRFSIGDVIIWIGLMIVIIQLIYFNLRGYKYNKI